MAWQILTAKDFETSRWAGGITTQLAIGPAGAQYPNRDFLWRISSAQVELEHSVFTNLPDYHRFLTVLDGRLELQIGSAPRAVLSPWTVCEFDGRTPVESWGRCTDLNLMLRKGACTGAMEVLRLSAGQSSLVQPDWDILGLFCVQGGVSWLKCGQFGLLREATAFHLEPAEDSVFLAMKTRLL